MLGLSACYESIKNHKQLWLSGKQPGWEPGDPGSNPSRVRLEFYSNIARSTLQFWLSHFSMMNLDR